ncbi:unnamed protein product [Caenorhabditis angaria]|uniref:Uncharacterized protein n=1 Tax=Caenorhabditis angaria TaxID=860376 RepID=A0A9P1INM1_9PELO|nr:unnamed protein product [Caenorhabditis angaria]
MLKLLSLTLLAVLCHVAFTHFTTKAAHKLYKLLSEANTTDDLRKLIRDPLIAVDCFGNITTLNGTKFENALNSSIVGKRPERELKLEDFNSIDNNGFEFTVSKTIEEESGDSTFHRAKYFAAMENDELKIWKGIMNCDNSTADSEDLST